MQAAGSVLADEVTHFNKRLLNFHGIEAVQCVDDLYARIGLVMEASYAPQAIHTPGLVSAT